MSTTYETEKLLGGEFTTDQVPFDAGTYYRGEALEFDTGTNRYQALASGGIAGIFLGEETTLANGDFESIITGGEIQEDGVVGSTGAALSITEAMRTAWAARGFYVKRQ